MEVIRIQKILARNWPIGICLHCVRTLSWFVPTMSTLLFVSFIFIILNKNDVALQIKSLLFYLLILLFTFFVIEWPVINKKKFKNSSSFSISISIRHLKNGQKWPNIAKNCQLKVHHTLRWQKDTQERKILIVLFLLNVWINENSLFVKINCLMYS